MAVKFLDKTGLTHLWDQIKGLFVRKSGDTMTGKLAVKRIHVYETDGTPVIIFGTSSAANSEIGSIFIGNTNRRMVFRQYNASGYNEGYYLPPNTAAEQDATHRILTSKEPVTVPQGGTNATTAAQARANLEITPANIGAVAKTGDTMTGTLTIDRETGDPNVIFKTAGQTITTIASDDANGHFYTRVRHKNNPEHAETYYLPLASTTDTSTNINYHFLTDKDYVTIEQGGTGAGTVPAARNNLGLGNTDGPVPVPNGGTGASTAAQARINLGITAANLGITAESIDAVSRSNDDTKTGDLKIRNGQLFFTKTVNNIDHDVFKITAYNNTRFLIQTWPLEGTGYTNFRLPVSNGLGSTEEILTSMSPVTIPQGGTGATDAPTARTNLGITPANIGALSTTGGTLTGSLWIQAASPYVSFKTNADTNVGSLIFANDKMCIRARNAGTPSCYTAYYLPEVDEGLTKSNSYYILTTKPGTDYAYGNVDGFNSFATSSVMPVSGYVTGSGKNFYFSVPVDRDMSGVTTITPTRLTGTIRTVVLTTSGSNYVLQGQYIGGSSSTVNWLTSATVSASKASNRIVTLLVQFATPPTNTVNNVPVAGSFNITFTFT